MPLSRQGATIAFVEPKLTAQQINLVKTSFDQASADPARFGQVLFEKLFAVNEGLRGHFAATDLVRHKQIVVATLATAISRADEFESLIPVLRTLGAKHRDYGVSEAHYQQLGTALLDTLEHFIGNPWTVAHDQAWVNLMSLIVKTMLEGAHEDQLLVSA